MNEIKQAKSLLQLFQLFNILMDSVGSLFPPMELTDNIMNTQFYDKVDDYKTLQ